jgi:hypothetical protein
MLKQTQNVTKQDVILIVLIFWTNGMILCEIWYKCDLFSLMLCKHLVHIYNVE